MVKSKWPVAVHRHLVLRVQAATRRVQIIPDRPRRCKGSNATFRTPNAHKFDERGVLLGAEDRCAAHSAQFAITSVIPAHDFCPKQDVVRV